MAMSFKESPLPTPSRVGLSGWAMLQQCQDTISDGGCESAYD